MGMRKGGWGRLARLEIAVLLYGIEAGTGTTGVQVAVTDDDGAGVAAAKIGDEGSQHCFLLWGAGVGWLTAGV